MDENRHKIFIILVFIVTISQVEKIETSSIIHKQTQKVQQKERKMKRDKMKINRKYGIYFKVYFDPTMWIS
jgi:hypothetical protein